MGLAHIARQHWRARFHCTLTKESKSMAAHDSKQGYTRNRVSSYFRPYVTTGIAIVGASVVAVTPITVPQTEETRHVREVQLAAAQTTSLAGEDLVNALVTIGGGLGQSAQKRALKLSGYPDLLLRLADRVLTRENTPDEAIFAGIQSRADELSSALQGMAFPTLTGASSTANLLQGENPLGDIVEAFGAAAVQTVEEIVIAIGHVSRGFLGALENIANGESPLTAFSRVISLSAIDVRNVLMPTLRALRTLPAPIGGPGGLHELAFDIVVAVTNAVNNIFRPPVALARADVNTNPPLAEELSSGVIENVEDSTQSGTQLTPGPANEPPGSGTLLPAEPPTSPAPEEVLDDEDVEEQHTNVDNDVVTSPGLDTTDGNKVEPGDVGGDDEPGQDVIDEDTNPGAETGNSDGTAGTGGTTAPGGDDDGDTTGGDGGGESGS